MNEKLPSDWLKEPFWTRRTIATVAGVAVVVAAAGGGIALAAPLTQQSSTITAADEPAEEPATEPEATVEPNIDPTATIGSPTVSYLTVTVTGTGTDTDGEIVSQGWNFGDGTYADGPTATHTYTAEGTYTITFAVTDDRGGVASATTTVTVTAPPPPPPPPAPKKCPAGTQAQEVDGYGNESNCVPKNSNGEVCIEYNGPTCTAWGRI